MQPGQQKEVAMTENTAYGKSWALKRSLIDDLKTTTATDVGGGNGARCSQRE